jgi:hypothetical protein
LKLDPKTALAEMGFKFPEDIEVQVVENSPGKVYLTLPVAPWSEAVTDAEIDPLIQAQGKSVCSKTYSCCCVHPDVVQQHAAAAIA